jgi:D-serine deaminase-like pyridoxal phosphate-dependent protein
VNETLAPALSVSVDKYLVTNTAGLLTPALLIYDEAVDSNIAATLQMCGGANRWRPHVKTAKLAVVMQRLLDHGVCQFKCATTRELDVLCQLGAPDVLLAFPVVGANAQRVIELALAYPGTRVSVLVESAAQLAQWRGVPVSIFIDLNPGMDRTGLTTDLGPVLALARGVHEVGLKLAGLHWYDGQMSGVPSEEREQVAHAGYHRLLHLVSSLEAAGMSVLEVITSGTPAAPHAISYPGFAHASFTHRISPGTPVYGDLTSLAQLPTTWGYRPAALVLTTVISQPRSGRVTCDAGHKSVGADAGVPTCAVLGHPNWEPVRPSEEHLPIDLPPEAQAPEIGTQLYLLPRHICPTINNFDTAIIVSGGRPVRLETVTARGHESRIL